MKRFAWFSALTTAMTFPLISLGAVVRLRGAGLACPDWPLCYGKVTPLNEVVTPAPAGLGIALEVGHRYWAGSLGLMVLALFVVAWWKLREHRLLRFWATMAFAVLIPQVILGGLTVLMKLAPQTVSLHLLFGNLFFASLLALTLRAFQVARSGQAPAKPARRSGFAWMALGVLGLIFTQIFLGGWVSASGASLACPDFPFCAEGQLVITGAGPGPVLQMVHRAVGFTVAGALVALAVQAWRLDYVTQAIRRATTAAVGVVVLQILIGWWNVANAIPTPTAALHTTLAATLAALISYTAIRAAELRGASLTLSSPSDAASASQAPLPPHTAPSP